MNSRVEYPWWVFYLTLALTAGSLWMTSFGSWLVATGWEPSAAYSLIGVFAVCNIGAVALGYAGAENWSRGAKSVAATALAIGLCAAVLSGIGTQRALTNMFEQNQDALRVETETADGREKALAQAVARVERATEAVAPLERQAEVAQREFERESASGFGAVATQRKAEWDATLAKLAEARRDVTAAEERLAALEEQAGPVERSDAALVAAKTSATEQWLQIWLGTVVIELLPMLSGWLFGIRVAAREDPLAALRDELGALRTDLAAERAKPKPALPPVPAPSIAAELPPALPAASSAPSRQREADWAETVRRRNTPPDYPEGLFPAPAERLQRKRATKVVASRGRTPAPPAPMPEAPRKPKIVGGNG